VCVEQRAPGTCQHPDCYHGVGSSSSGLRVSVCSVVAALFLLYRTAAASPSEFAQGRASSNCLMQQGQMCGSSIMRSQARSTFFGPNHLLNWMFGHLGHGVLEFRVPGARLSWCWN
jgi:hypothetical protein